MKIDAIADDFTGASDIAFTHAEGGMREAQLVGIPDAEVDVDTGVVSLKSWDQTNGRCRRRSSPF